MKRVEYNKEKDKWLRKIRGVSFEEAIDILDKGRQLDILKHPNKRYKDQKIYIIELKEYVYAVPFVEDQEKIFLKTIYPTRKYKKKYLKGEKNEKEKV